MAFSAREIQDEDLLLIAGWRMDPDITKWMDTDPVLTLEDQRAWLAKTSRDEASRHWLLEVDGVPAGVLQLFDIDFDEGIAEWGYYIGAKELRSMAFAVGIEMSLYRYCFEVLGLRRVVNSVHSDNMGTIRLHQLCGNTIVRIREHAVEKNGSWFDLVDMEIDEARWRDIAGRTYERIEL